eukprot:scaffold291417_cov33-Tisochrysis_lutea.AAC.1
MVLIPFLPMHAILAQLGVGDEGVVVSHDDVYPHQRIGEGGSRMEITPHRNLLKCARLRMTNEQG